MPACDLDRSVAFCFYNKREKPNTIVSVFSGEVHPTTKERILSRRDKMKVARHEVPGIKRKADPSRGDG